MDEWLDIGLGLISDFVALKNQNPNARFIYSVGGWNAGSATFSRIAASHATRVAFANNALDVANRHGFDGFDLDWVKNNFPTILIKITNYSIRNIQINVIRFTGGQIERISSFFVNN